jgi:D-3-phosphoglycerate dehydrogenase
LTAKEYSTLKPYLKLANLLGSFAGQLTENPIKSVRVEFEGQTANLNSQPILQTIVFALLKPAGDSVNLINSLIVAKSKSIEISSVNHQRESEYQSLIKLIITTEKQTRSVCGTIFGGEPRIVEIKGIKINAELSEHNLYISNEDKPGFIRDLSKILADENINIASLHLGRDRTEGKAIALISIDSKIDNNALNKIKSLPLIIQAKYLEFNGK